MVTIILVLILVPATVTAKGGAETGPGVTEPIGQDIGVGPGVHPFPDQVSTLGEVVNINLNVYKYSQKSSTWRYETMGTTDPEDCGSCTIGGQGCLLTCVAMVFRYYGDVYETPKTLNTAMGDYACPFYFFEAENYSNGTATFYDNDGGLWPFDYFSVVSFLNAGWPVPCEHERWDGTKWRTHWVLFKKCAGDWELASSYWVVDPNGGTEKRYDVFLGEYPWSSIVLAPYQHN